MLVVVPISVYSVKETQEEVSANNKVTEGADKLYRLGLFEGTGLDAKGKPIYDFDHPMT
ncbi:hypothetical protein [Globicatella sulfidifaciens]|uniref:Uncharacterized protein n=1 Tax=Globicatella sulfidifaciens TaxID=136093 RepID=A0A7X8C5J7_9LACT|nr:hypothetical protein [Globicatella sulfidifaciens]NLJ19383.1 hypothetical protein [Globicatella sulfidifaciens]